MDCAQFERELVELMDVDPEAGRKPARETSIRDLQEHASRCEACAECADLLRLLDRSAAAQDPAEDPGRAYWDGFETRTRQRIRREAAPVRTTTRRWMATAAAVAVLFLLGTWAVRRTPEEPSPVAAVTTTVPVEPRTTPGPELPEDLARLVKAAPGDGLVFVDELPGWGPSAEAAGFFPDVSDLDAEARQAFVSWLREQAS